MKRKNMREKILSQYLLAIPFMFVAALLAFLSGCGGGGGGGSSAAQAESGYIYDSEWTAFNTTPTTLSFPNCVAADSTSVYICDYFNSRVLKINKSGLFILAINPDKDPTDSTAPNPGNISFDTSGNIYITDDANNIAVKYNTSGIKQSAEFKFTDTTPVNTKSVPTDVAVDSTGKVYITDLDLHIVAKYDSTGVMASTAGGTASSSDGKFNSPNGIAIDSSDNLFVADTYNNRIQKLNTSLGFSAKWGTQGGDAGQFSQPAGIAVDSSSVYVADTGNNRIQKFTKAGIYAGSFGGAAAGNGKLNGPVDVAVDPSTGYVYVADASNNRVVVFRPQ